MNDNANTTPPEQSEESSRWADLARAITAQKIAQMRAAGQEITPEHEASLHEMALFMVEIVTGVMIHAVLYGHPIGDMFMNGQDGNGEPAVAAE